MTFNPHDNSAKRILQQGETSFFCEGPEIEYLRLLYHNFLPVAWKAERMSTNKLAVF